MQPNSVSKAVLAGSLALACGLGAGMQAHAAEPSPKAAPGDSLFRQLDTDHDRRVSRAEAATLKGFAPAFDEADADKLAAGVSGVASVRNALETK